MTWTLTPARAQVAALVGRGTVARPARVAGDKGYTRQQIRGCLWWGIGAVIPRQQREPRHGARFDRDAYRERNIVERPINRLQQYRAIATRYEKPEETYHALAAIRPWLPV